MKTLKDIKHILCPCGNNNEIVSSKVLVSELHKSAIEWIKLLQTIEYRDTSCPEDVEFLDKLGVEYIDNYNIKINGIEFEFWAEATDVAGSIKMLMHFFNITEEDLK